jgi:hypothetical protein
MGILCGEEADCLTLFQSRRLVGRASDVADVRCCFPSSQSWRREEEEEQLVSLQIGSLEVWTHG